MAGLGVQGQAAQAQGTGRILEWPKVWLVAQADWSSPAHPSASTVGCGRAPEECSDGPKRVVRDPQTSKHCSMRPLHPDICPWHLGTSQKHCLVAAWRGPGSSASGRQDPQLLASQEAERPRPLHVATKQCSGRTCSCKFPQSPQVNLCLARLVTCHTAGCPSATSSHVPWGRISRNHPATVIYIAESYAHSKLVAAPCA